ncbi:alpha-1,2-fucosyltransferase [Phocaeicola sp.]
MKYIYPKMFGKDLLFIRLGGNGLANCMFVMGRAVVLAHKYKAKILRPTWERFSFNNYIRCEKDKRTYRHLFKGSTIKSALYKFYKLQKYKNYKEEQQIDFSKSKSGVLIVENFTWNASPFKLLIEHYEIVCHYFNESINSTAIHYVNNYNFNNVIGIHVRLGDYKNMEGLQTSIDWYVYVVKRLQHTKKGKDFKFIIFSDGKDIELAPLLNLENTKRIFFGNALADIVAMSKCKILIGSDSSFSAWGAFLGQIPFICQKMHFGNVLKDTSKQFFFDHSNNFDKFINSIE